MILCHRADADKDKTAEEKPAAETPKTGFTFSMPKPATPETKSGAGMSFADLAKKGSSGFGASSGGLSFSSLAQQAGGSGFSATPVKEAPKITAVFGAKKDGDEGEVRIVFGLPICGPSVGCRRDARSLQVLIRNARLFALFDLSCARPLISLLCLHLLVNATQERMQTCVCDPQYCSAEHLARTHAGRL